MAPDQPRRALAIVSPDVGDGKTYLASNIAAADVRLTADQMTRLDQISAPQTGFSASLTTPSIRRMVYGGNDVAAWAE